MKLYFCTLFDSNYFFRGLTLYYSLYSHCKQFHLYIFAFDDFCYSKLIELNLPSTTVIPLSEFETKDLLKVKQKRTSAEYCWTSTPLTIWYCLKSFGLSHCTYIDADTFFFQSPMVLLKEMKKHSVLITKHNYSPQYDQSKKSGTYCVQFITFKNNTDGLRVLEWWKKSCLRWCFNKFEKNRFGDQKYLDDWTERFKGVYVLKHIGGGVAPWNVQQYDSYIQNTVLWIKERITCIKQHVIFYHFHGLRIYRLKNHLFIFSPLLYTITYKQWVNFYGMYRAQLQNAYDIIQKADPDFTNGIYPFHIFLYDAVYKYIVSFPYLFIKKIFRPYETYG